MLDADSNMLDADSKKWLSNLFGSNVKYDESMSKHTSFRAGGRAEAYVVPETLEELSRLMIWIHQNRFKSLIIGG